MMAEQAREHCNLTPTLGLQLSEAAEVPGGLLGQPHLGPHDCLPTSIAVGTPQRSNGEAHTVPGVLTPLLPAPWW